MAGKACLNHIDREAVAQCHQCHKPVCKSCIKQDPAGSFCSTECLTKYKDFKARYKEPNLKKPCLVKGLVGLVVAVELAAYGLHSWLGVNAVACIDFLGRFLPGKH